MNRKVQIITTVATCVMALAAVWGLKISLDAQSISREAQTASDNANAIANLALNASEESNVIAGKALSASEKSNQIAEKSLYLSQRAAMPLITAYYNTAITQNKQTETIIVSNDGGKIGDIQATAYFMVEVGYADKRISFPIVGYYINQNSTLARQGILLNLTRTGNSSDYSAIRAAFYKAAEKENYKLWMTETRILKVIYTAATTEPDNIKKPIEQYFRVYSGIFPDELTKEAGVGLIDAIDKSQKLANANGLNLYVWDQDGSQLWSWVKSIY